MLILTGDNDDTNDMGYAFGWQTRFYDHIIRNDVVFQKISDYILHNPLYWEEDRFFDMN